MGEDMVCRARLARGLVGTATAAVTQVRLAVQLDAVGQKSFIPEHTLPVVGKWRWAFDAPLWPRKYASPFFCSTAILLLVLPIVPPRSARAAPASIANLFSPIKDPVAYDDIIALFLYIKKNASQSTPPPPLTLLSPFRLLCFVCDGRVAEFGVHLLWLNRRERVKGQVAAASGMLL